MKFSGNVDREFSYALYPMQELDQCIAIANFLDDREIELLSICAGHARTVPGIVQKYGLDETVRKSNVSFLKPETLLEPFYRKLTEFVHHYNNQCFRYRVGFIETLQYTEYKVGYFYDWHKDTFDRDYNIFYEQRKLSISIQLSDESEYEGGDLELYHPEEPKKAPKQKGTVILFPSFMYHRVTPVTKGRRLSLVSWINGPDFC